MNCVFVKYSHNKIYYERTHICCNCCKIHNNTCACQLRTDKYEILYILVHLRCSHGLYSGKYCLLSVMDAVDGSRIIFVKKMSKKFAKKKKRITSTFMISSNFKTFIKFGKFAVNKAKIKTSLNSNSVIDKTKTIKTLCIRIV